MTRRKLTLWPRYCHNEWLAVSSVVRVLWQWVVGTEQHGAGGHLHRPVQEGSPRQPRMARSVAHTHMGAGGSQLAAPGRRAHIFLLIRTDVPLYLPSPVPSLSPTSSPSFTPSPTPLPLAYCRESLPSTHGLTLKIVVDEHSCSLCSFPFPFSRLPFPLPRCGELFTLAT